MLLNAAYGSRLYSYYQRKILTGPCSGMTGSAIISPIPSIGFVSIRSAFLWACRFEGMPDGIEGKNSAASKSSNVLVDVAGLVTMLNSVETSNDEGL